MKKRHVERKYFQVAIDGPVAAGKGTVARLVAERLGWLYVDTGAMYRATALLAARAEVSLNEAQRVARLVKGARFEMRNPVGGEKDGRLTTILVDGEDVSWKIRTEEVSHGSSVVAAHKAVREALVAKQKEIARSQNLVMEGRDITFRVLPQAQLKIYLTASEQERTRRRYRQLLERGEDVEEQQVFDDLRRRDERDSKRNIDPLQVVPGAWVLDTTHLTISQVVEIIVKRIREDVRTS